MTESQESPQAADHRLLKIGSIILALGFLATAGGSIWTILSPIGGGVNFGAGLLYEGGMLVGVVGLALTIAGLIAAKRSSREN